MFRKHFKRLFCKKYKKKTGLNGYVYDFSVDYNAIAVVVILDVHKCFLKKHDIK